MSVPCKGPTCQGRVDWAQFEESGKWAPFDEDSAVTQKGEVRWVLFDDRDLGSGKWARRAKIGEPGQACHWGTCDDEEYFRNRGGG